MALLLGRYAPGAARWAPLYRDRKPT
jgi:hypothetical protein